MVTYKDRTREFFHTTESFANFSPSYLRSQQEDPLIPRRRSPKPTPLLPNKPASFISCAYQLHTDILNARKRQALLDKLASSTSLQETHRPSEFTDLLNKCKGELLRIEKALESLAQQHIQQSGHGGFLFSTGGPSEIDRHRESTLAWLRKQLMEDTSHLQECLFTRKKVLLNFNFRMKLLLENDVRSLDQLGSKCQKFSSSNSFSQHT